METNNNQLNFGQLSSTISNVGKAFVVSKLWRVVLLVVVGLGVGIYFIVRSIKKSALKNIPLPELPSGQVIDPTKGINSNEEFKTIATQYTDELFSAIDGWFTLAATKEKVFKKLWALNDTQLVYVHRVWATRYYAETQMSMTKAIESETNYVLSTFGGVRDKLILRLKSLNAL